MLWWLEKQHIHAHLSFLLLSPQSKHDHTLFSQSFFLCQPQNAVPFLFVHAGRAWRQGKEEVTPEVPSTWLLCLHSLSQHRGVSIDRISIGGLALEISREKPLQRGSLAATNQRKSQLMKCSLTTDQRSFSAARHDIFPKQKPSVNTLFHSTCPVCR